MNSEARTDKLKQEQRDQYKKPCLPEVSYISVNDMHQKGCWEAKLIQVVSSFTLELQATHKVSGDVLDPNLLFSGAVMVRITARKINLTYNSMNHQGMQLSTVAIINSPFFPVL